MSCWGTDVIHHWLRRLGRLIRRCIWPCAVALAPCQVRYARLRIGHPVRLQGLGSLRLGDGVQLGFDWANGQGQPIVLQPRTKHAVIDIGARSAIMNGCCIIACESIIIGADVAVGAETLILDSDFHGLHPSRRGEGGVTKPIVIEDNVFIGTRVTILKGVTIGRNAVVGAGAVVASDVQSGWIVAGNPARRIGSIDAL